MSWTDNWWGGGEGRGGGGGAQWGEGGLELKVHEEGGQVLDPPCGEGGDGEGGDGEGGDGEGCRLQTRLSGINKPRKTNKIKKIKKQE